MSEIALQNLLAEHAESLFSGSVDRAALLAKYHFAPNSQAADLLDLAERLYYAMPIVKPADRFIWNLYEELVGVRPESPWGRWARHQMERFPILPANLPNLPNVPLPVNVNDLPHFRQLPRGMQLAAYGLGGLTLIWFASRSLRENGSRSGRTA
jgi:hypothetical protein